MNSNDQFRELIEAYAIGSLDAPERAQLEAHLASGCDDCEKALQEARWLVSQLAYLAPNAEPSDMLKGRLLQTVRAEAAGSAARRQVVGGAGIPSWLWAGVAALLLFSLYSAWIAHKMHDEVAYLQQQAKIEQAERERLEAELGAAKTQAHEAMIWSDPKSKKIMLRPKDPKMPDLEAMWHPDMGLVVRGWKVPSPGEKRMLQLWLIPKAGGKPMPSMTLWPDANGKFSAMVENPPDTMSDTQALAITEEPIGGSPQPTSAPMWVGGVS
ncbi:MAG: Anti-sigma-K factor rskA [Candidatus Acidoferrum typicum]|nr:Anti-sigma-K factor rskA [Candidatus Acidoferrum typicum]